MIHRNQETKYLMNQADKVNLLVIILLWELAVPA